MRHPPPPLRLKLPLGERGDFIEDGGGGGTQATVGHSCILSFIMYTDKKENKIFLIYKEIQMESGVKSYMRKGFLIYEEMHTYFHHI